MKPIFIVLLVITACVIISDYFFEYIISREIHPLIQLVAFIFFLLINFFASIITIKQLIKFFKN